MKSEDRISMVDIRVNWRLGCVLPILALSVIMPACNSPGGPPPPLVRSPDGSTSRFALRPILDGEGYRPYYVAGYAGASYGPGLFSRRSMVGYTDGLGPGHSQCDGRAGDVGTGVSASAFAWPGHVIRRRDRVSRRILPVVVTWERICVHNATPHRRGLPRPLESG